MTQTSKRSMTYNATGSPRIHINWAALDSAITFVQLLRLSIKKWAIGLHDRILIERSGAYLPLLYVRSASWIRRALPDLGALWPKDATTTSSTEKLMA